MSKILFRAGEATIEGSEGQATDAMPEILIGDVDGPVGQAFANMMAQHAGHTSMFAVRDCNQMVRPVTMMVPKVTMKNSAMVDVFGGIVQGATADAVLDCVIEGILPKDQINNLVIIDLVWVNPACLNDPNRDDKELYKNHYDATKLAITRAMNNEPSLDELIANRKTIRHYMIEFDPDE